MRIEGAGRGAYEVRPACCAVDLINDDEVGLRAADPGAALEGGTYSLVDDVGGARVARVDLEDVVSSMLCDDVREGGLA